MQPVSAASPKPTATADISWTGRPDLPRFGLCWRHPSQAAVGGSDPCTSHLMIGERNPNQVCVYPDSSKMAVDALRREDGSSPCPRLLGR
ncbi:MAG: hypothetical protein AB7I59_29680 [Geminicoccaceae bacterium]